MGFGEVASTLIFTGLIVSSLFQILGIRVRRRSSRDMGSHTDPQAADDRRTKETITSRLARWRRRPRAQLSARDWLPHTGFLFLPSLIGSALVYGGVSTLVRPHQNFRLGGLLALIAGLPVVTLTVLFVLRPSDPGDGRFELSSVGYNGAEVDAFFQASPPSTPAEIRAVRFSTARPGYDMEEVGTVLDRGAVGAPHTSGGTHRAAR
jgi:DivIVA domain-containing protein